MSSSERMNILAVSGSKRKKGNTSILIDRTLKPFRDDNSVNVDVLYLGEMNFEGCSGCEGCSGTNRCVLNDDMQTAYDLLRKADGIIAGSPTYFYNMTSLMKKFIDRCYCFTSYGKDDRSVWTSELDRSTRKMAGYISICEQNSMDDMGYTAEAMEKAFGSLGFRTVFSQKVLHCFKAGEVESLTKTLTESELNGLKLKRTIELQKSR